MPTCLINCVPAAGLDDSSDESSAPALLEVDQGDVISGKLSRADAAQVVAAALNNPDAALKTFEVRRSEARDAKGKAMTARNFTRLFLKLALGEWGCIQKL